MKLKELFLALTPGLLEAEVRVQLVTTISSRHVITTHMEIKEVAIEDDGSIFPSRPRTGFLTTYRHLGDNNRTMTTEPTTPVRLLTQEEKNDLRRRVLAGGTLTLEEARAVIETYRAQQGAAIIASGAPKKRTSKKPSMSDDELERDLADLGL